MVMLPLDEQPCGLFIQREHVHVAQNVGLARVARLRVVLLAYSSDHHQSASLTAPAGGSTIILSCLY